MIKKVLLGVAATFLMVSCSADKSEKPQEENVEIQKFAEKFASFTKANQIDSIKAVYPTANFDSVASIANDSISISESGAGLFKINYTPEKWIDVKVGVDGKMTVENSKGIAVFPEEKYQTAKTTGMLNDSINDVKTQELLNDEAYFKWLNDRAKKSYSNLISLTDGKTSIGKEYAAGAMDVRKQITLTNNSNTDIKKSDFEILYTTIISTGDYYEKYTKSMPGCDLKANETRSMPIAVKGISSITNPRIKLKISLAEYLTKYYKPTGKEYQEYLNSKK